MEKRELGTNLRYIAIAPSINNIETSSGLGSIADGGAIVNECALQIGHDSGDNETFLEKPLTENQLT